MPGSGPLHKFWIWVPVLVYVILIFYLSSLSQVPWTHMAPDYVSHALEYFGLALLVARGLNDGLSNLITPRRLLISFLLCLGYAILDEIHQIFVPNRYADVLDVLSDVVGIVLALALFYLAQRLLLRSESA
jgi:VanZ family protein